MIVVVVAVGGLSCNLVPSAVCGRLVLGVGGADGNTESGVVGVDRTDVVSSVSSAASSCNTPGII